MMETIKAWFMNQYNTEKKRTVALTIIAVMVVVAVVTGIVGGL